MECKGSEWQAGQTDLACPQDKWLPWSRTDLCVIRLKSLISYVVTLQPADGECNINVGISDITECIRSKMCEVEIQIS